MSDGFDETIESFAKANLDRIKAENRIKELESAMDEFIKDPEATGYWQEKFKQLLNKE